MTLWPYLIADFELISSTIFRLTTKCSTCCRSFARLITSLGIAFSPSAYIVATMYASYSLIRLVGLPIMFLIFVRPITSLTTYLIRFSMNMRSHKCSREVNVSGGKITVRVHHKFIFGTPNLSRR